jgi:hypothetical protein
MNDDTLSKELAKRIAANIGASPIGIGKVGLTDSALLKPPLKIEEDGIVKQKRIWYGSVQGTSFPVMCLLVELEESPLCVSAIFGFNIDDKVDDSFIAFQYTWDDSDSGSFYSLYSKKLNPMSIAQKLQFSLGIEYMVQSGALWLPGNVPDALWHTLHQMIEVDEEGNE